MAEQTPRVPGPRRLEIGGTVTRRRSVSLLSVIVLAGLAVIVVPAAPAAAQVNEVTNWNRIATETLVLIPGPASGAPPALQINMGMTQGAVYDAVNAITPKHHRPYLLKRRFSGDEPRRRPLPRPRRIAFSPTSFPRCPPASRSRTGRALLESLARHYDTSLAAIPDSTVQDAGDRRGDRRRQRDDRRTGGRRTLRGVAVEAELGSGALAAVLPNGTSPLDPTPWVGGVKPFLLQSSSQFRSDGPLELDSAAYAAELNEVKALGGDGVVTPSARAPDEEAHNAVFWQSAGGPALLWNGVARNLAEDPAMALDLADSARLLAMMNLSGADAAINCWNDKYHFDFWRPWQAIRQADLDDNPATEPDPTWTPLLTAPYPTTRPGTSASTAPTSA